MGCEGCLLTQKEKQRQYDLTFKKAKDYAVQVKQIVVIYVLSDGTYQYMGLDAARTNGITPVAYVSYMC
jgi:hypothetical protein